DSIFMMPQLGVLSKVNEKAATDVFIRDCLIHLGTCIAPVVQAKMDEPVADIEIGFSDGRTEAVEMRFGSLQTIPLPWAEEPNATVRAIPRGKADFGAGPGKVVERKVAGGLSGLILDGRGRRPFLLPKDDATRVEKLQEWQKALDCYPTSKS
ncbi:methylaspartate mutase, partial [bacterium]|nr:methylaspartate mutase [bacterium]